MAPDDIRAKDLQHLDVLQALVADLRAQNGSLTEASMTDYGVQVQTSDQQAARQLAEQWALPLAWTGDDEEYDQATWKGEQRGGVRVCVAHCSHRKPAPAGA